ncbi:flagellin [Bacillus mycoides]|uniref:flagellin N-terminal helical domain-containing protein n=1 Tax=Bacillus mycoides TaxID=1405 RepID=UPI000BF3F5D4|nr:flagellin [Bacillus mycoides]PGA14663.1 flagellin [Bacillus mycoides]
MRINTNINSMRTQEYMRQNQAKMSNSMDRLSSGKRINNASDDAAGLAIATRMRARESGLGVAANNTQDGISLIRTADSAMNSVSNILLRMRDLANQSANGTNTDKNQVALQKEFGELQKQIDYIAQNTQFNDKNLLSGKAGTPDQALEINIQTLDSSDPDQQIKISLDSVSTAQLGVKDLQIGSSSITQQQLDTLNNAMKRLEAASGTPAVRDQDVADAKAAFENVKGFFSDTDVDKMNQAFKGFANETVAADKDGKAEAIYTLYNGATITKPTPVVGNPASVDPANSIKKIDEAIEKIASSRATLGATLNRLDFNVNNLKSQQSSMASAASQVEDADMAKEMSEMTKFKILNEAGISMLSQANQTPQMVSKLLQ